MSQNETEAFLEMGKFFWDNWYTYLEIKCSTTKVLFSCKIIFLKIIIKTIFLGKESFCVKDHVSSNQLMWCPRKSVKSIFYLIYFLFCFNRKTFLYVRNNMITSLYSKCQILISYISDNLINRISCLNIK